MRTVVLEESMAFTPPTMADAHSPSRIPAAMHLHKKLKFALVSLKALQSLIHGPPSGPKKLGTCRSPANSYIQSHVSTHGNLQDEEEYNPCPCLLVIFLSHRDKQQTNTVFSTFHTYYDQLKSCHADCC